MMAIGWGLTTLVIVGGIIARDRYVLNLISTGDKAVEGKVDIVHERINKTRDDFVRRDDLDSHMKRIEGNLEKMYTEQRETNQRIDGFMAAMVNGHNDRRNTGG